MIAVWYFLNSSFFVSVVTGIVGLAAYLLYRKQKADHKKDAANIILLEVQNAERTLRGIKESLDTGVLPRDRRVMPTENWSRTKYLFVRDLDRDEWDALSEFYSKCNLIDELIGYNNSSFWNDVEQIRANKQRILADYTKEALSKDPDVDTARPDFEVITAKFDNLYMSRQGYFAYSPQRTMDDAKLYIGNISLDLSQQAVGTKLKKLANIK